MAGVKLREIPFKGAGPALIATLSGEVAVDFGGALTVSRIWRAGGCMHWAVPAPSVRSLFPICPRSTSRACRAIARMRCWDFSRRNTPRAIVDLLDAKAHKAMRRPDTLETMHGMAVDIALSHTGRIRTPDRIRDAALGELVRALNLKRHRN